MGACSLQADALAFWTKGCEGFGRRERRCYGEKANKRKQENPIESLKVTWGDNYVPKDFFLYINCCHVHLLRTDADPNIHKMSHGVWVQHFSEEEEARSSAWPLLHQENTHLLNALCVELRRRHWCSNAHRFLIPSQIHNFCVFILYCNMKTTHKMTKFYLD